VLCFNGSQLFVVSSRDMAATNSGDVPQDMQAPAKPFRRPWKLVEHEESFAIVDAGNTVLAMIYHEDEPGRRTTMKRLSREDADLPCRWSSSRNCSTSLSGIGLRRMTRHS